MNLGRVIDEQDGIQTLTFKDDSLQMSITELKAGISNDKKFCYQCIST